MVKFNAQEVMERKDNIRNVSIIAHVDHGKSTLTESLVAAAGIIGQEAGGDVRMNDTRGITTESTGISLYYEMTDVALKAYKGEREGNQFLINLIDTPGHVDFSAEVTSALRITDGALLVVDCVDGVAMQTEAVLQQALRESIRPVLAINKMDKCFLELQVDGEVAYQMIRKVIEDANVLMATYKDPLLGDVEFCPEKGTVAFSSGLHGWAFTLADFAKLVASKKSVDEAKVMERLWGDNFYDSETKKWTTKKTNSCKRGFVKCVYEPIQRMINTCMDDQKDKLWPALGTLGVTLKDEEKELTGKALMMCVMQNWFPASKTLLEMTIFHLPSPATAQKYRVERLYTGPLDDEYATAIRNCDPDPNGPLMLYVSKMIPASVPGKLLAFGRVFSGTVAAGSKVRIMGPDFVHGEKKDLYTASVLQTAILMGKKHEAVANVPCGNTVAMAGLERYICKTATLSNERDERHVGAHPIRTMKFSASPVVHITVQCKYASDLPKLREGINLLSKSDPLCVCSIEETGEYMISGIGELHVLNCFTDLKAYTSAEIFASDPFVSYRETVVDRSCRTVSKSPNMHNRLYMEARPLEPGLVEAIDSGQIGPRNSIKEQAKILAEQFGWDKNMAKDIWYFGPETVGPNLVLDACKGVYHLPEIKESVISAFKSATKEGVLAKENMRGICFELHGFSLHSDTIHRGPGQMIAAAQKAIMGSQLRAKPRLMEPVYLVEIQVPHKESGGIGNTIYKNLGSVIEEMQQPDTQLCTLRAYLPVRNFTQFSDAIRGAGNASMQIAFDHWELMKDDPLEAGTCSSGIVREIRRRKGLKELVTELDFEEVKV